MESEHGGVVVKGRAIIDTRPPFRSVKEAVALFGERVLVGEIYAKQLKEIQQVPKKEDLEEKKVEIVSSELEETKQSLQKAREEGNYMANCLKSLKQQLEETKRELHTLKAAKDVVKDHHHHTKAINPEIEELKFVETNANKFDNNNRGISYDHQQELFQKKKFVTFASPPSLTREIKQNDERTSKLERSSSFRKDGKKKPSVAIMGWLFSRKKRSDEGNLERSPKV
ncbi:WEB family protein At2g17940-like [Chenopodium quinoa]|uniref:WEB family protein n=1 Tax=Chenopodium quinoa TaxID=63459 RepID=A0A803MHK8_CHEQI|nr:WEB family protein At2g17940-like [Chenopodium quinoa]